MFMSPCFEKVKFNACKQVMQGIISDKYKIYTPRYILQNEAVSLKRYEFYVVSLHCERR